MSDQFFDEDIENEWGLYEYLRRIGLDVEPPIRKVRKIEHIPKID